MSQDGQTFKLEQEGNTTILVLLPELNNVQWGDIDAIGTQVLNSISDQNHPNILVDLSPLNYMGSAMVALIVRVWKAAQAKNGKISVACPHDGVKEVLKLASLDKVWAIVETREEASKALGIRSGSFGGGGSSSTGGGGMNAGWIVAIILLLACVGLGVVALNPGLLGQAANQEQENETEVEETTEPGEGSSSSDETSPMNTDAPQPPGEFSDIPPATPAGTTAPATSTEGEADSSTPAP